MITYQIICVVVAYASIVESRRAQGSRLALLELQQGILGSSRSNNGRLAIGEMKGSECVDKSTFCEKHKAYCNNQRVQYYCEKTCGKCSSTNCYDIHPQCNANAERGFCAGRANEVAFMKTYCKKSCKFCQSKPQPKSSRACGIATIRNRKGYQPIVGGKNSVKGYFPWQVAIYDKDQFLCGGSLIDEKHVLTAAHCFNGVGDEVDSYLVVLGEYNRKSNEGTEQEVKVSKITVHERYDSHTNQNDIAVVELSENAKISDHIETICLPNAGEERPVGSKCIISGWGKQYVSGDTVDILQELEVPIVGYKVCNARNIYTGRTVTEKMMCSGYNDGYRYSSGCHGDSGGPLSCETGKVWKVFGVVSWGSPQCNGLDRYTVYTKVSSYLQWIREHTSN